MQLWKIIDDAQRTELERTGSLVTDERRTDADFRPAYRWMGGQMRRRLGACTEGVDYPQWAWVHWLDAARRRPDLRTVRHLVPEGRHFLVELEIDETRVLVSDFERWHFVLNGWYLPRTTQEMTAHEKDGRPSSRSDIERSWEDIFEISEKIDPELWGRPDERSLQATFWTLHSEDIRSVRPFESARSTPEPTTPR